MTTPTAAEWIEIEASMATDAELAPLPYEDLIAEPADEEELAAE
jgi:hypothetical protein